MKISLRINSGEDIAEIKIGGGGKEAVGEKVFEGFP